MAIDFMCPACRKEYEVSDNLGGKKAQCKECGAIIRIPLPPPPPRRPERTPEVVLDAIPIPPRRPAVPPTRRYPSGWSPQSPYPVRRRSPATLLFLLGTLGVLLGMVGVWAYNDAKDSEPPPLPPAALPPRPVVPEPSRDPVTNEIIPAAIFPARGPGRVIEPGVRVFEVSATGNPLVPTTSMTVWLYLPDRELDLRSLPCVVIAPARSQVVTGMWLGDKDRAEHLPYVRAGYAVLAYSLDGSFEFGPGPKTNPELGTACSKFVASNAGLFNADAAMRWMLRNAPEVDSERIYAAGHNSAGTVALLLAEHNPRIRACAVFAPRSDTTKAFPGDQLTGIKAIAPSSQSIFAEFNPAHHCGLVKCPIYLFQAQDDDVVEYEQSRALAQGLREMAKRVTFDVVESGGHYDGMIQVGIPRAMEFFTKNGSKISGK